MNVLIVCSGNFENFSFEKHQAFIYDQINAVCKFNNLIIFHTFFIKGRGVKGYLQNLKQLRSKIKEAKIDLIHAHGGHIGLLCALQRKVPGLVTFHGSDINNKKLRVISFFAELLSKKTIYVSSKLLNKAIYITKQKSFVIPCGVDTDLFYPVDFKIARLKTGFGSQKKHILFSSAFTNSVKNYPLLKQALQFISDSAIEVHELKNYSREEVNLLINSVNLCVMTSFTEGSPQFIKEAMACNVSIVSTDVGDVKDILENTEGTFICTYDPNDVAEKIKLALAFGKRTNGREKIKHLDNKLIAEKIVNVYKTVLKID